MSSRTQRFLPAKIQRNHNNQRTKPEQFEDVIREAFDFARKISRKGVLGNETDEYFRKSYENYIEKRRKAALRATLADTLSRYQTIMDPEDAVIAWIELNAPLVSFTHMEEQHHVLFAAAIWMLDRITSQDSWRKKLFRLLPRNDREIEEFYEPNAWDCSYEYDLIASVVSVLYYRNLNAGTQNKKHKIDPSAVEGFDDRLQLFEDHPYVLTSEYAATHKLPENWRSVHEDDPHRECFRALLALVPQEAIDSIVDQFHILLRQWADRFFDGIAVIAKDRKALDEKKSQIAEEHNKIIDELEILMDSVERKRQARTVRKKDKDKGRPQTNPLLVNPLLAAPAKSVYPLLASEVGSTLPGMEDFLRSQAANQPPLVSNVSRSGFKPFGEGKENIRGGDHEIDAKIDQIERLYHRIENLETRFDELHEQTNKLYARERKYSLRMSGYGRIANTSDEDYSGLPTTLVEPMHLPDAYGLCFALLYLIETGDDLPWLYGACYGFMMEVCESLPWGLEEYDEIEDPIWEYDQDEVDVPKTAAIPDWNERKHTYKDSKYYFPRSLAQILYEETGCILPRDCTIYYPEYETIRQHGLKGKDAGIMMLMSAVLGTVRRNIRAHNLDPEYFRLMDWDPSEEDEDPMDGEADAEPKEDQGPESNTEQPRDEKDQLIAQLREELKKSKAALHSAETESRNARKELTSARSVYEREHRELADLREIVFNAQFADASPDQQPQSPESPEYDYPYETRKRTTVFGGHDTFLKAIKPMLPNVRFIDANYMTFSPELVRNADIVWVQTNCISHPMFWNVVKYAKQFGVQLRYFTQASAEKCADQVVEADKRQ